MTNREESREEISTPDPDIDLYNGNIDSTLVFSNRSIDSMDDTMSGEDSVEESKLKLFSGDKCLGHNASDVSDNTKYLPETGGSSSAHYEILEYLTDDNEADNDNEADIQDRDDASIGCKTEVSFSDGHSSEDVHGAWTHGDENDSDKGSAEEGEYVIKDTDGSMVVRYRDISRCGRDENDLSSTSTHGHDNGGEDIASNIPTGNRLIMRRTCPSMVVRLTKLFVIITVTMYLVSSMTCCNNRTSLSADLSVLREALQSYLELRHFQPPPV